MLTVTDISRGGSFHALLPETHVVLSLALTLLMWIISFFRR
jgi:hypothetical protein